MELPDQTDVNKTYQRRQFLCEIGDQREKETRFHNMKEGDSCKLKYSEVKSKEKCCERRGLHFPAVCLERGAGAKSLFCFPGYLLAIALSLLQPGHPGECTGSSRAASPWRWPREGLTHHLPVVLLPGPQQCECRAGGTHMLLLLQVPSSLPLPPQLTSALPRNRQHEGQDGHIL